MRVDYMRVDYMRVDYMRVDYIEIFMNVKESLIVIFLRNPIHS